MHDSGNSFSSHTGKVKVLKSHYSKIGFQLDVKYFDKSWKEEVYSSVKNFEALSFQDPHSKRNAGSANNLGWGKSCNQSHQINKSSGSDSIVGELIKYGG